MTRQQAQQAATEFCQANQCQLVELYREFNDEDQRYHWVAWLDRFNWGNFQALFITTHSIQLA